MSKIQTSLMFPLLLVFYEISAYLSNDMYLPALPTMMQDIGLSLSQAQLTLTAWFLGAASMPLVMGAISDHYGRRPILLYGGIIYVLATMVCALANNPAVLLVARVVQGGMTASVVVPGYATIHELYEHHAAIRLLAFMSSITVLAPALGPLAGGIVLYLSGDWRAIFWVIIIWSALALFLLFKIMPETQPVEKRHPLHWRSLGQQYRSVLTNLKFLRLAGVLGFIFGGFLVWVTAGPLLLIESFHYTPIQFGLVQAGVFAVYIFGNRLVKYLLEAIGVVYLIRLGLSIALCGGVFMLCFAHFFPNRLSLFLAAMTLYSFGTAFCFAPLNRLIIEAADAPMGIRVGMFTVVLTGFAVLGSSMASLFFNGTIASLAYLIGTAVVISASIKLLAR
jgi:Bcr/CflA subfamily drug resistance transporter